MSECEWSVVDRITGGTLSDVDICVPTGSTDPMAQVDQRNISDRRIADRRVVEPRCSNMICCSDAIVFATEHGAKNTGSRYPNGQD